jgi:hypothetical protein
MCLIKNGGKDVVCKCPFNFILKNDHECKPNRVKMPKMVTVTPFTTTTSTTKTTTSTTKTITRKITTSVPKLNDFIETINRTEKESKMFRADQNTLKVIETPVVTQEVLTDDDSTDNTVQLVTGLIFAIILFIVVGMIIYCCIVKKRNKSVQATVAASNSGTGQGSSSSRSQQVFFRNPTFGLENNLKEGIYTKTHDEELQTIEVVATPRPQPDGRYEFVNYSLGGEEVNLDTSSEEKRPVSQASSALSSRSGAEPLSDFGIEDDNDKCRLIMDD